jgi:hypothetical protein
MLRNNSVEHNNNLLAITGVTVKIFLYFIGKARDEHANAIAAEFIKRSSRYAACEMREIVPQRFDLFARHPSARKIFLDPAGRSLGSFKSSAPPRGRRRIWCFSSAVMMAFRRNGSRGPICCCRFQR